MPGRRYQINATDWFDCLAWLDYQLSRPDWPARPEHPIHGVGIAGLKNHLTQWRVTETTHKGLYQSAQLVLNDALQDDDWDRLRKALSAIKRRRQENRLDTQPANITLSAAAHELLLDYKQLSGALTLSDALEQGLQPGMLELAQRHEQKLLAELLERVGHIKASELVKIIENYLKLAVARRSLANSCKIARQLFLKRPDRGTYKLMMERFVEDLVWNSVHLKIDYREFELFTELLDPLKDLKPALATTE
jgi:hypothetical protein